MERVGWAMQKLEAELRSVAFHRSVHSANPLALRWRQKHQQGVRIFGLVCLSWEMLEMICNVGALDHPGNSVLPRPFDLADEALIFPLRQCINRLQNGGGETLAGKALQIPTGIFFTIRSG
jgi:hypothetical protein